MKILLMMIIAEVITGGNGGGDDAFGNQGLNFIERPKGQILHIF
jgi:hypothetical protein